MKVFAATFSLLAVLLVNEVSAIGNCDNTLVTALMNANLKNCFTNVLQGLYKAGPLFTFRVHSKAVASAVTCASAVVSQPDNNYNIIQTKYTFSNTSLGSLYTDFHMVEAKCGIIFKYVIEESYVGFKLIVTFFDGISLGYYACSNEKNRFSGNDLYAVCIAKSGTSKEIEASVLKCKAHMEQVTGAKDLTVLPACDNDNKFAKKT